MKNGHATAPPGARAACGGPAAWRRARRCRLAAALLLLALAGRAARADDTGPLRIVSMNPSITSILVALDAAALIVGAEQHSLEMYPQLAGAAVPVGGLFNPSLESVVALAPDVVALVPSAEQRDFKSRVEALGIEVLVLPNISVAEILRSIEVLGERVGRRQAAAARVARIRAAFEQTRSDAAGREPVRVVVVLQRDPLYVVGAGSFIDEMLAAAGAENPARALGEPYPRTGIEWLIAAAPDLILDGTDDPVRAPEFWSGWPSIPAVAHGRVLALPASATFPGADIDRSLAWYAEHIWAVGPASPAEAGGAERP